MLKYFNSIPIKKQLIFSLLVVFSIFIGGCKSQSNSEIREGRLQINGIEIYYKIIGNGPPIFILHGGPGDGHDTMLQLMDLADKYTLIFYDQRAAARSTGDADTASHTIENFVEDLEQLRLKLAPEKITIIGGSWGAMLAMQYALKYSENINALVLMSSMGPSSEFFIPFFANREKNRTAEDSITLAQISNSDEFKNRIPETMEKYWRTFFRAYFYNPDLADSIKLFIRDTTYKVVSGKYSKLWEYFRNYDIRDDLKNISCPTLIVHGDHDPIPVKYAKQIQDNIPGSQLVILKNAGHWLWVEAPDQLFPLIKSFLEVN